MAQSLISLTMTQLIDVVFYHERNNVDRKILRYKRLDVSDDVCHLWFQVKIVNISWALEIFQVVGHVLLDYSWSSFESFFFSPVFNLIGNVLLNSKALLSHAEVGFKTLLRSIVFTFHYRTFPFWTFVPVFELINKIRLRTEDRIYHEDYVVFSPRLFITRDVLSHDIHVLYGYRLRNLFCQFTRLTSQNICIWKKKYRSWHWRTEDTRSCWHLNDVILDLSLDVLTKIRF